MDLDLEVEGEGDEEDGEGVSFRLRREMVEEKVEVLLTEALSDMVSFSVMVLIDGDWNGDILGSV